MTSDAPLPSAAYIFIQNLPSSQDEADEYSGDDEEVKQAATPRDETKIQKDTEQVSVLLCCIITYS